MAQKSKWAILLCNFKGGPSPAPHDQGFYREMFCTKGAGGACDYWLDVSGGLLDISESEVFGWRTLSLTEAECDHTSDPSKGIYFLKRDRYSRIRMMAEQFQDEVYFPDFDGIIVVAHNSSSFDAGSVGSPSFNLNGKAKSYGAVLAAYSPHSTISNTFFAHEMAHGLGLADSFDDSGRVACDWCAPGAYYDPWDLMSAMNVHSSIINKFNASGPILNAVNMCKLGWLHPSRLWDDLDAFLDMYSGLGGTSKDPLQNSSPAVHEVTTSVELAPLNHPEIGGFLAACIRDYIIEFRVGDGWDSGSPGPCLLVHKKPTTSNDVSTLVCFDKTKYLQEWPAGSCMTFPNGQTAVAPEPGIPSTADFPRGLIVAMKAINMATHTAVLEIIYRTTTSQYIRIPDPGFIRVVRIGGSEFLGIHPSGDIELIGPRPPERTPRPGRLQMVSPQSSFIPRMSDIPSGQPDESSYEKEEPPRSKPKS